MSTHKKLFNTNNYSYLEYDLGVIYDRYGSILNVVIYNTILGDVSIDLDMLLRTNPSRYYYIQERVNEGLLELFKAEKEADSGLA